MRFTEQSSLQSSTGVYAPDDHLISYRFIGRMIGRALFDGQLIRGHMVRIIYKHLLGWPITVDDVKAQDEEYFQSLKKLSERWSHEGRYQRESVGIPGS